MEDTNLLNETTALIVRDLGLESTIPILTEAALLEEVAQVVAYMIEHKLDLLLSTMYRMDIDEVKIHDALNSHQDFEPVNYRLAKLIIERQKKRVLTKHSFKIKNSNPDLWEDV